MLKVNDRVILIGYKSFKGKIVAVEHLTDWESEPIGFKVEYNNGSIPDYGYFLGHELVMDKEYYRNKRLEEIGI